MVSIDHVAFAAIENAGIDDPGRAPELRLFVEWDGPESIHPGRTRIDHPSGAHRIAWLELGGDPAVLDRWTTGAELPVRFSQGSRGIYTVVLRTRDGELVVR